LQLVEEVEVSGSEEEIEDEQEETEDGGKSSGSELEPVEEDGVWFLSHSLFSDEPCVQWLFKSNSTSVQYVTCELKLHEEK
jgi:hypothetical protein